MTAILEMDPRPNEVVWKAITQHEFRGIYGTRLWCDNILPETRYGTLRYKITRVDCNEMKETKLFTYSIICIVRLEIVD